MHGMRVLVEVGGPMKMHNFVGGIFFGGARAMGKNRNVGAVSKWNEVLSNFDATEVFDQESDDVSVVTMVGVFWKLN